MRVADNLIRDIVARFEEIGSRFDLIKRIDEEIVKKDFKLDEAIADILSGSMNTLGATTASAFVVIEKNIIPFPANSRHLATVTATPILNEHIRSCTTVCVCEPAQQGKAWLLIPLHCDRIPSLKIVLTYETIWHGGKSSRFHDPNAKEFADMLAAQCNILFSRRIEADIEQARKRIMDAFFTAKLDARWLALANGFREFLPSWEPLRITPPPEVQILTYDGDGKTILLRAGTTDPEPRTPKTLYIDRTVSGIIVEEEIKGTFLDKIDINPSEEYTDRFASYLLHEHRPKSELVIPVRAPARESKKTVWLINLEHAEENVFLQSHIEMVRYGTEEVMHLVTSLLREEEEQTNRDRGHFYMLQKILNKMAKTYSHKVGQQTAAAKLSLDALEGVGSRLSGNEKKFFDGLKNSVLTFVDLTRNFVSGLPDYVAFGRVSLIPLLTEAVAEFDPYAIEKAEDITISIKYKESEDGALSDDEPHLEVFGSKLIREHIYNLINNSLYAVRNRLKSGDISKGEISITTFRKPQTDYADKKDSFWFVHVRIDDNGGGLSGDAEKFYANYHYSTKGAGGTGFGAVEAREYMEAIGGRFSHTNQPGQGLSVVLRFPEYDQETHEHRSRKMNLGASRLMEK